MTVRFVYRVCLLALFALTGCNDEVTRTQLTFALSAPASLQSSINSLAVTVRSSERGDQMQTYKKSQLDWPVEIVVLPAAGNKSRDAITLLISALAADGTSLAEVRANGTFSPERLTRVEVTLDGPPVQGDDGGAPPPVDGGTPTDDAGQQTEQDSGNGEPPPENCKTKNTKIKCDDGNACNGKETCNPDSPNADTNGCVMSDSPVSCPNDMTCDSATGECSTCLKKADGDGDGINSIACGGKDCDDTDPTIAPGKPEKCNNKDDDCDGVRDGTAADTDPTCTSKAPTGGSAYCSAGACAFKCTVATQEIVNGVCTDPVIMCPAGTPCAPGTCSGGNPNYTCTCPAGYRTGVGMSHCVPVGVPTRTIGFETTCEGAAIPGTFDASGLKPIQSNLYASCGPTITSGSLPTLPQLAKPAVAIAGMTDTTVLVVTQDASSTTMANSQLSLLFGVAVVQIEFDILDIDKFAGLQVATLYKGAMTAMQPALVAPVAPSKQVHIKYLAPAGPADQVLITYAPMAATDQLYIDQLAYRVGGCGDGVVEGSEACDDMNLVQCDGCDNACAAAAGGCLNKTACVAPGAASADGCTICNASVVAPVGGDKPMSKNPSAPVSCGP
jgi:cysteine-rich repeat protein